MIPGLIPDPPESEYANCTGCGLFCFRFATELLGVDLDNKGVVTQRRFCIVCAPYEKEKLNAGNQGRPEGATQ